MNFDLTRKINRKAKPIVRKFFGQWLVFVRPGVTDRIAANKADDWCRKQNASRS